MIVGIGSDIVQISRIEQSLSRFGDRFAARILTIDEMNIYMHKKDRPRYLAGRFAAKEACVKALGSGFSQGLWFTQIGVVQDDRGKPELYCLGDANLYLQKMQIAHMHLSITHEKDYALAFVVLEKNP